MNKSKAEPGWRNTLTGTRVAVSLAGNTRSYTRMHAKTKAKLYPSTQTPILRSHLQRHRERKGQHKLVVFGEPLPLEKAKEVQVRSTGGCNGQGAHQSRVGSCKCAQGLKSDMGFLVIRTGCFKYKAACVEHYAYHISTDAPLYTCEIEKADTHRRASKESIQRMLPVVELWLHHTGSAPLARTACSMMAHALDSS
jgi:hypothetical protein